MTSMPAHLTAETIERYRARTLAADELLPVAGHLGVCQACRDLVATPAAADRLMDAFAGPEHLNYEALEAIARGTASSDHLSVCPMCLAELNDLRAFRAQVKQREPKPWRGLILIPAAAALMAVFLIPRESPHNEPPASTTAALVDDTSPADRQTIAEALRTGRMIMRAHDPDLVRSREFLLGDTHPAAVLRPESPVGEIVLSQKPAFHWVSPESTKSIRIDIYDANFELACTLTNTVWPENKTLTRGAVYTWTISAQINGGLVTAPRAPEPEARFRVATKAEAEEMDAARNAQPTSELRIAATAARLGFRDEAREALERYGAHNPPKIVLADR